MLHRRTGAAARTAAAWLAVPLWPAPRPEPAPGLGRCPTGIERTASEVEPAGRAFGHQTGPPDIAAHGAQVAMPGMAHSRRAAHARSARRSFRRRTRPSPRAAPEYAAPRR